MLLLVTGQSASGQQAPLKDPKEAACVIFSTDAETPVYDILFQPHLIKQSLEINARPSVIKTWLENFFLQHALPYYKLNEMAVYDLKVRVSEWRNEALQKAFEFDADALEAKVQAADVNAFSSVETSLLIHGTAMAYLSALRQTESVDQRLCLTALETQIESKVDFNRIVLEVDTEYRNQMYGIAIAIADNISRNDSGVFDDLKSRLIDPLSASTFKNSSDEIDWLSRIAGKREEIYVEDLSLSKLAFLNVLNRAILLAPPPQAYQWSDADLLAIESIVKNVRASVSPEVKKAVIKRSRQYAMVLYSEQQRTQRTERVLSALKDDRLILALGGASLAAWAFSFDYIRINKGFWRLPSDFLDQAKLNLPKEIALDSIDDQLRTLIENSKVALPASSNAAFAEAIRMGRLQFIAVESFKSRFIAVFGEKAWSGTATTAGAGSVVESKIFKAGSDILDEVTMRRLSSALTTLEMEGSTSLRQAAQSVHRSLDANISRSLTKTALDTTGSATSLTHIKAWRVEMRAAYREMRSIGKVALAEEFVQAKTGSNLLGRSWEWIKYQGRLGRANLWSFPSYKGWRIWDYVDKVPYADRIPFFRKALEFEKFNVAPGLRNGGLRSVGAAGEEVAAGSKFTKVLPGEATAASSMTWRSVGRNVLHTASWILLLYSIGQVTWDGIQAYRIRSPQDGLEDLKEREKTNPQDAEVEMEMKNSQISALRSALVSALDGKQAPNKNSLNKDRLMNGLPELEVVVNAESSGAVHPLTGFMSTAYVLFKVREPARDGTLALRRENALSGILVRFRLDQTGQDAAMAKELGVARVPESVRWVYDHAVVLRGLDPSAGGHIREAIHFSKFSLDSSSPKIVVDPAAANKLFRTEPLWETE